jgi:hypothetical protein
MEAPVDTQLIAALYCDVLNALSPNRAHLTAALARRRDRRPRSECCKGAVRANWCAQHNWPRNQKELALDNDRTGRTFTALSSTARWSPAYSE